MQIESTKKLFTVDDYYRMSEAGIIGPEERVELIDGEIIEMSPIGHNHAVAVTRISYLLMKALEAKAIVRVQNPLQLSAYSEPQPDLAVLKYRADFYKAQRVTADDALLIVEVSDTTLHFDQQVKLVKYAEARVPEVWIENLKDDEVLVYRELIAGRYKTSLTLHRGQSVSINAFPETVFTVDALLG